MGWFYDLFKDILSVPALRERIKLAEERFKHVEDENKKLKKEVDKLSQENNELKSQLKPNDVPLKTELEDTEIDILKFLSKYNNRDGYPAKAIASELKINLTTAQYYLKKMADSDFLFGIFQMGSDTTYKLDQKGREYLVKNNII